MAGSNCTNHAEPPLEAHPLQADDAECLGVEGHRHLRQGLPAQDDSSDMLFGSYTIISQPEASEKAKNIIETQTLYKAGGNIIEEETEKKEEEALCKEEKRRSGRVHDFISIFQMSSNLEPYLHVPGRKLYREDRVLGRAQELQQHHHHLGDVQRGDHQALRKGLRGQGEAQEACRKL